MLLGIISDTHEHIENIEKAGTVATLDTKTKEVKIVELL